MRLVFCDRATMEWQGRQVPVTDIVERAAKTWLMQHLRFIDPEQHVVIQNELRPGSPELVDIFARGVITANDTSAAVGYAPLTETERFVLEAEQFLNSREFKEEFPETGEDIKVMGVREDRKLYLTISIAFVDQFLLSSKAYFEAKSAVRNKLLQHLQSEQQKIDRIEIELNTLDDPRRGEGGMYLTVLGTSAEGADSGQVGRGNRVNGLISLHRPMSTEAAAGKNSVSHVGKIYNLLSHQMAHDIYASVVGIEEVYVWLCSQIGRPLEQPWSVAVELLLANDAVLSDVEIPVKEVIHKSLAEIHSFTAKLTQGKFPVY